MTSKFLFDFVTLFAIINPLGLAFMFPRQDGCRLSRK
jgi:hypothetical protein